MPRFPIRFSQSSSNANNPETVVVDPRKAAGTQRSQWRRASTDKKKRTPTTTTPTKQRTNGWEDVVQQLDSNLGNLQELLLAAQVQQQEAKGMMQDGKESKKKQTPDNKDPPGRVHTIQTKTIPRDDPPNSLLTKSVVVSSEKCEDVGKTVPLKIHTDTTSFVTSSTKNNDVSLEKPTTTVPTTNLEKSVWRDPEACESQEESCTDTDPTTTMTIDSDTAPPATITTSTTTTTASTTTTRATSSSVQQQRHRQRQQQRRQQQQLLRPTKVERLKRISTVDTNTSDSTTSTAYPASQTAHVRHIRNARIARGPPSTTNATTTTRMQPVPTKLPRRPRRLVLPQKQNVIQPDQACHTTSSQSISSGSSSSSNYSDPDLSYPSTSPFDHHSDPSFFVLPRLQEDQVFHQAETSCRTKHAPPLATTTKNHSPTSVATTSLYMAQQRERQTVWQDLVHDRRLQPLHDAATHSHQQNESAFSSFHSSALPHQETISVVSPIARYKHSSVQEDVPQNNLRPGAHASAETTSIATSNDKTTNRATINKREMPTHREVFSQHQNIDVDDGEATSKVFQSSLDDYAISRRHLKDVELEDELEMHVNDDSVMRNREEAEALPKNAPLVSRSSDISSFAIRWGSFVTQENDDFDRQSSENVSLLSSLDPEEEISMLYRMYQEMGDFEKMMEHISRNKEEKKDQDEAENLGFFESLGKILDDVQRKVCSDADQARHHEPPANCVPMSSCRGDVH